jgi:hypothetical protein
MVHLSFGIFSLGDLEVRNMPWIQQSVRKVAVKFWFADVPD